jgi:hypothetical protein
LTERYAGRTIAAGPETQIIVAIMSNYLMNGFMIDCAPLAGRNCIRSCHVAEAVIAEVIVAPRVLHSLLQSVSKSLRDYTIPAGNLFPAAGPRFLLAMRRPKPPRRRRKTSAFFGAKASLSLLK